MADDRRFEGHHGPAARHGVGPSGAWLLRERTGESASTRSLHLPGATLAEAARLIEVDLEAPLDVGHDALLAAEDPHATAVAFLQRGVELLAAG